MEFYTTLPVRVEGLVTVHYAVDHDEITNIHVVYRSCGDDWCINDIIIKGGYWTDIEDLVDEHNDANFGDHAEQRSFDTEVVEFEGEADVQGEVDSDGYVTVWEVAMSGKLVDPEDLTKESRADVDEAAWSIMSETDVEYRAEMKMEPKCGM